MVGVRSDTGTRSCPLEYLQLETVLEFSLKLGFKIISPVLLYHLTQRHSKRHQPMTVDEKKKLRKSTFFFFVAKDNNFTSQYLCFYISVSHITNLTLTLSSRSFHWCIFHRNWTNIRDVIVSTISTFFRNATFFGSCGKDYSINSSSKSTKLK